LVYFPPFWYVAPRKIWQPWCKGHNYKHKFDLIRAQKELAKAVQESNRLRRQKLRTIPPDLQEELIYLILQFPKVNAARFFWKHLESTFINNILELI
jgi:hypothetical protein